jgi:hypothetical protein
MGDREVRAGCGDRENGDVRIPFRSDDCRETADGLIAPLAHRFLITDPQKWLDLCA